MHPIDAFDYGASRFPDRTCMVDAKGSLTYRECEIRSHKIAARLRQLGVGPDTKVALYSKNSSRALECMIGIFRSGGVYFPLNHMNELDENAYQVDKFDVSIILYDSEYEDSIKELRRLCPDITATVSFGQTDSQTVQVDDWLLDEFEKVPSPRVDDDAAVSISASGGTTGRPKGVVFSQRTWTALIGNIVTAMPGQEAVHCVAAPLTHAAGAFAFPLFALGATQVILSEFNAAEVLNTIERERVTHLFLPPTAIYMLLSQPDVRNYDYSSLKYFVYASAPMSVNKVREAMDVFGDVMTQTYGQAEAGAFVGTMFSPEEHRLARYSEPDRLSSCGRPTLFTRVEIVNDNGSTLDTGEIGEIAFSGEFQMKEYYNDPEETARVRKAGRIHTGDIGRLDEEGYLYILDRKREMIISGGFNVFPSEVENVLFSHPAILGCAVVGVPDEKWGEAVKAVIELRPGMTASKQELMELCKAKLGSVKAPKTIEFWNQLPKSNVGKILRRKVRSHFWAGREGTLV